CVELIDHRVHGFLDLENFTFHFDRHLLPQVARGNGGRDLGYVAKLDRQVRRHQVDVVGEILPCAGDSGHDGLSAEFAFGSDFASDAADFGGERVELIHHRIDGVFQFEDFSFHVHGDLARQIATRHGSGDLGDVADLSGQVGCHGVHVVEQRFADAADIWYDGLSAEFAFGSDFTRDTADFGGERVELIHHRVDRVLELKDFSSNVHCDLLG